MAFAPGQSGYVNGRKHHCIILSVPPSAGRDLVAPMRHGLPVMRRIHAGEGVCGAENA